MAEDGYIFWQERRPRCLACGSPDLKTYRSMPAEADGSRLRYVTCGACARKWKLVVEPEPDSFCYGAENHKPNHGESSQ